MRKMTRREAFSGFLDLFAERIRAESPAKRDKPEFDWVWVGRLADLSPGTMRSVGLGGEVYTLRSNEEGVWLEGADLRRVALRAEAGGNILANLNQSWPSGRLLSHLTGEAN